MSRPHAPQPTRVPTPCKLNLILGKRPTTHAYAESLKWTCDVCGTLNQPRRGLVADYPVLECACGREANIEFDFSLATVKINGQSPVVQSNVKTQKQDDCLLCATASNMEISLRMRAILSGQKVKENEPKINLEDLLKKYENIIKMPEINKERKWDEDTITVLGSIAKVLGVVTVEEESKLHKLPEYKRVKNNFYDIVRVLADGYPLTTGFIPGKNFWTLKPGQIYKAPREEKLTANKSRTGHSILLIGAGRRRNTNYYHFLNSWGEVFCLEDGGRYGFGMIRASDIRFPPVKFLRYEEDIKEHDMLASTDLSYEKGAESNEGVFGECPKPEYGSFDMNGAMSLPDLPQDCQSYEMEQFSENTRESSSMQVESLVLKTIHLKAVTSASEERAFYNTLEAEPREHFKRVKIKELAVQRAKQLQAEEERTKRQKAKALAKLKDLNKHSSVYQKNSSDPQPENADVRNKEKAGLDGIAEPVALTAESHDVTAIDKAGLDGTAEPAASTAESHDVPANNNIGFTFPHVPPGDNTEATGSAVPLASNKDNKQTSASPFMFGAKPSSTSDLETSTTAGVKTEGLGESITKSTSLDNTNLERSNRRESAGDIHKSPDKVLPTAPPASTPPLHFASAASTPSLSNGLSHASPPKLSNVTATDKPAVSFAPFTNIASFAVSSSSPPISSSVPAFPTISFGSSTSAVAAAKSESISTETKPASTLSFGTVGTSTEGKSVPPEPASKTSTNLNTSSIFSSNVTTFLSSPVTSSSTFSSAATLSSSPFASSGVGIATTNSAPSTTLATAPGVQSASAPAFAFSSSGNSIFGFSSPAQSTGLSTTVGGTTSQASAASTIFDSKLPQPQGAVSQSSATQFSSSFPTVATGAAASSLGSGTVSFGAGASPSAPGNLFGAGASSSGPGTVCFGAGASSSGPGSVSIGVGASSSGPGLFSLGAGVSSSGPGAVSFGAAPSSSGPGTVSFGATTSSSPFGSRAAFSGSGSGFAFSSPSSSAASSLTVASTNMFSSSSTASSPAAFSNPFGSTSSPPSMFAFGQPASSGAGFSFGAQSAPAFSSPSPQVFSFTSASMNSSTPQPAFGMTNANTGFGMGSPGNDQMNMEDSMADDTNQAAPPQVSAPVFGSSVFGQPANSPALQYLVPHQLSSLPAFFSLAVNKPRRSSKTRHSHLLVVA